MRDKDIDVVIARNGEVWASSYYYSGQTGEGSFTDKPTVSTIKRFLKLYRSGKYHTEFSPTRTCTDEVIRNLDSCRLSIQRRALLVPAEEGTAK